MTGPAGRTVAAPPALRGVLLLAHLAVDAVTGVRQRVEPLEVDQLAAAVAEAELVGRLVEAAQRFLARPELDREELPLGSGSLGGVAGVRVGEPPRNALHQL